MILRIRFEILFFPTFLFSETKSKREFPKDIFVLMNQVLIMFYFLFVSFLFFLLFASFQEVRESLAHLSNVPNILDVKRSIGIEENELHAAEDGL